MSQVLPLHLTFCLRYSPLLTVYLRASTALARRALAGGGWAASRSRTGSLADDAAAWAS